MYILNQNSKGPRLTVIQGGKADVSMVEVDTKVLIKVDASEQDIASPNCIGGVCTLDWKPRRPTAA
ncbi:MAG TPA: hypothetical protein V6C81_16105 [Planktothrix sp.]|jgi:hypothetical protein